MLGGDWPMRVLVSLLVCNNIARKQTHENTIISALCLNLVVSISLFL